LVDASAEDCQLIIALFLNMNISTVFSYPADIIGNFPYILRLVLCYQPEYRHENNDADKQNTV
jgi:hypothetical protein